MAKAPAFQLYAKDFLEGTAEMSNAEAGAYIRLLCHQWMKGGLKNDDKILARLCGGDTDGLDVAKNKFKTDENGLLKNDRLAEEKGKQEQYSQSQSEIGKKGAEKRWGKNRVRHSQPHTIPHEFANGETMALHTASTTTNKSKLSVSDVFRIMRSTTDRQTFSDALLEAEALQFFDRYKSEPINNLGNLVATWIRGVKPDILPKRMIV